MTKIYGESAWLQGSYWWIESVQQFIVVWGEGRDVEVLMCNYYDIDDHQGRLCR